MESHINMISSRNVLQSTGSDEQLVINGAFWQIFHSPINCLEKTNNLVKQIKASLLARSSFQPTRAAAGTRTTPQGRLHCPALALRYLITLIQPAEPAGIKGHVLRWN